MFNFYRPGYVPPNTQSGAVNMTVPEFQLVNGTTIPGYINFITFFARGGTREADLEFYQEVSDTVGVDFDPRLAQESFVPNYSDLSAMAEEQVMLLDRVDLLLTANQLSQETKETLIDYIEAVPLADDSSESKEVRAALAVILVMTSTDYLIQR